MELSLEEVCLILGEKDILIYQLTKEIKRLKEENGRLQPADINKSLHGRPHDVKSA